MRDLVLFILNTKAFFREPQLRINYAFPTPLVRRWYAVAI